MVVRSLYELKTIVAVYPRLALPAAKLRAERGHGVVIDESTDILIEGYPRSANNFALAAFNLAQSGRARIAHHVHAPAHVIAAIKSGIPVLVLIRNPEDAVLEFLIRRPWITVGQAIRGYVRFYEPLLPYANGFVVGEFAEVVSDFGAIIRKINDRFGTTFCPFEHTEGNVRACFDAIEQHYRERFGSGPELERIVPRPSSVRDQIKRGMRGEYQAERLRRLRMRAQDVYETFR